MRDKPNFEKLKPEYSTKNLIPFEELTPGSKRSVLWECDKGHEWKAIVQTRSGGTGCPYCSNSRVLPGFNDLTTTHPEYAAQLSSRNTFFPTSVTAGSDKEAIWECGNGHETRLKISRRTRGKKNRCAVCSNKRVEKGYNDVATTNPEILDKWSDKNIISPETVVAGSHKKIWWECDKGHEWIAPVNAVTIQKTGCPVCIGRTSLVGFNDLASLMPELAKEWSIKNRLSAHQVTARSSRLAHWVCLPHGHEWETRIVDRTNGVGCPYCANYKVKAGFNDLLSQNPLLVKEWSSKNEFLPTTVTVGSDNEVLWECKNNHEWTAAVKTRSVGVGCPYCANQKVKQGFNDLLSRYPLIAEEYSLQNIIPSSEIAFGSKRRVGWICENKHKWESPVYQRTINGGGCRLCSHMVSKMETDVADFIRSLLPDEEEVMTSVRGVIPPKELDIYVPGKQIAVEFNGLFWHTESKGKDSKYHYNKWKACADKDIQLIQVWEDQWKDAPEIIKRMLAHKLGVNQEGRVYGRKTTVSPLNTQNAQKFLNNYHIQGFVGGSYYLGLRQQGVTGQTGEIVAVMILKKQGEDLLLSRYATSKHVIGGQSKLVKYAEKNLDYTNLITFADLEVSDGALYERTGFIKDKFLMPDYKYLYEGQRQHKFRFRLARFRRDPDLIYEEGLSERELALLNGVERIWDSGKIRYIKSRPDK